jgi:multidrug efflux pump subunit AcrA (membrane-fusion protein)
LGFGVLLLLGGGLAFGAQRYYQQNQEVMETSERLRVFVPDVRVATVSANSDDMLVTLPATTAAFATANIFARASGYIDKRVADIGDRVKEGELLAEITAPELDQQIAQAQATLAQTESSLRQTQANSSSRR